MKNLNSFSFQFWWFGYCSTTFSVTYIVWNYRLIIDWKFLGRWTGSYKFNFFLLGARIWGTVLQVRQCQIALLLFKLEQTPTAWPCLRRKGLAWRYNYLIVWRMETHHYKANCRIHKELPATRRLNIALLQLGIDHCLAIVFPVEILAKDVRVIWQSSEQIDLAWWIVSCPTSW